MDVHFIRNATMLVNYGGVRLLIDPYLAEKEAYPGFGSDREIRNPRVALQTPIEQIVSVDAVIVTHTHSDHWDVAATQLLPKHLPIFVQHETDAALIRSQNFADVRVLTGAAPFLGISMTKVPGQHGSDAALAAAHNVLGDVCGVVFRHAGEKTLYVAGDTVWNEQVASNLASYMPEVVVLNTGDARLPGLGSILMGKGDVKKVHEAVPGASLIAVHMEALNHCVLKRDELRAFADANGIDECLTIPVEDEAFSY